MMKKAATSCTDR